MQPESRDPRSEAVKVAKRAITIADAERMLRSTANLLDEGTTERLIAVRVSEKRVVRVRRGHYVTGAIWDSLWPEGRHLLKVLAVCRAAAAPPIVSHVSAAVAHGFPLYRLSPKKVHLTVPTPIHVASRRDVLRHELALSDDDVVEVDGIRVTSPARTVLDIARTLGVDAAQSIADAALRRVAVTGQRQDADLAAAWREDLSRRLELLRGRPGTARARRIVEFADGRAQLPGESVSRLRLRALGFREVGLQVPVAAPDGSTYYVDFGLDEIDAFGEFDGLGKYIDPSIRGSADAETAVVEEKWREDWVRGTTGRRMLRWGGGDIDTVRTFAQRLVAFGVPLTADLRLDRRRLAR